jgi:hypothetical protein
MKANGTKTTNATELHDLQTPVSAGFNREEQQRDHAKTERQD